MFYDLTDILLKEQALDSLWCLQNTTKLIDAYNPPLGLECLFGNKYHRYYFVGKYWTKEYKGKTFNIFAHNLEFTNTYGVDEAWLVFVQVNATDNRLAGLLTLSEVIDMGLDENLDMTDIKDKGWFGCRQTKEIKEQAIAA